MATKPVVQQNREAAVGGGVKQQQQNKVMGGGNRRALNDIGNIVTIRGVDGKPLTQVSRPVTRSFCAHLLANAHAAANENKKQRALVGDEAKPAGKEAKAVVHQKRVTVEPKPEAVIEISPDTEEVKKHLNTKKANEGSSKKKDQQTFTSTLTARSKAACGLTYKPKEQIVDIDSVDINNELAAVEYVEDMYKFYKLVETESQVFDYMGSQPEINGKMRAILVDWLIEVNNKFELTQETLYLTINIVDRYLATETVPRRELQLVGISAMLMASKYEEIWAPEVNDFVLISDKAYTHQQVLVMEKKILGGLEWNLTVPTPYVFLVRFIKAASVVTNEQADKKIEHMAFFLAELGLMNYATVTYCPSMVAASAVYAARCSLSKIPFWNKTLKLHTGFSEPQLMDCARALASFHSAAAENKLMVIYRKYSKEMRGGVALIPPAKSLLTVAAAAPV